jgi:hypothetical protein
MGWKRFVTAAARAVSRGDRQLHAPRIPLSLHALGGVIALMTGPLQFLPRFQESNWNRHRLLGWIYWVDRAACADRLDAAWGFDPGRGLDCSDWTGYMVYIARRCDTAPAVDDSQLRAHRCCHHAADLPAPCFRVSLAFAIGYPAIAWLCWIPNVIAVELYLRFVPTPSGISVPGRLEFQPRE